MLKLLVFISIAAKLIAYAWASEQEVACAQQTTQSFYNKFLASLLQNLYTSTDDASTDAISRFHEANDVLMGICSYNQICTSDNKNMMSSIYPLLFQLAQMAAFADESTREQYLNIMNLDSMDEMDQVMSVEPKYFTLNIPYNYTSTIKYLIMAHNTYQFTDDFKNKFSSTLGGETTNMDFEDSSAVSDYLNTWMGQTSCNQDYDFLGSKQSLDGLITASVNYFTVYWKPSFKPSKTVTVDFCESDGNVVKADAFYIEGNARYKYDEYLDSEIIEIPLLGDFKIRITYPKVMNKLEETIFKMRTPSIYKNTFDQVPTTYLQLTLPSHSEICEFEDYVTGLKLVNMMTDTFLPETNVFSCGFENESGPFISHMFHKMHFSIEDVGQDEETDSEVSENCETSGQIVTVTGPYIAQLIAFDNTIIVTHIYQRAN